MAPGTSRAAALLLACAAASAAAGGDVSVYESLARLRAGQPAPDVRAQSDEPARAEMGGAVTLAEPYVAWDGQSRLFEGRLELSAPAGATPQSVAPAYLGPARKQLAAWLAEGTAAGNFGDLYFNRDGGHSRLATTNFPMLTALRMDEKAVQLGLDRLTPNMKLPLPVIGNASLAMTEGFSWRSSGRYHTTMPAAADALQRCYDDNQFWIFPAVDDYSSVPTNRFDYFAGAAPFQLLAEGRSWSDRPYLAAAAAASAAFRPGTKRRILAARLYGPTLQWLFRRCRPGVKTDADYLTEKAHPTVFGKKDIDADALVARAHGLSPEDVPPAASLSLVKMSPVPAFYPEPARDFADIGGELLCLTPSAIHLVLRDASPVRTVQVVARARALQPDAACRFKWAVVHGDPATVRIAPPPGRAPDSLDAGEAQISIDRRRLDPGARVDVACFAYAPGTACGAPAFVSFSAVALEKREWRADGLIASIDYTNPDGLYCDPAVALPRRWKDVYTYDGKTCTGFLRYAADGTLLDRFTAPDTRVAETAPDGKPARTVKVHYVLRDPAAPGLPPELTYADTDRQ